MTKRKIILAGGTGFVGKYLKDQFANAGYEVIIISRQKDSYSQETDGLINLYNSFQPIIDFINN
jgi:nucleoside-diphosphate-sugar epimerase